MKVRVSVPCSYYMRPFCTSINVLCKLLAAIVRRPYHSLKCFYRHTLTTVVMGRSTASRMSLDVLTGSAYTLYRETTPFGVAGSLHLIHTSGELVTLTERERGGDGPEHRCVWMHVSKECEHCLKIRIIQTSD